MFVLGNSLNVHFICASCVPNAPFNAKLFRLSAEPVLSLGRGVGLLFPGIRIFNELGSFHLYLQFLVLKI